MFAGRCVYVRNRPQPFATVRNRPQPSATVRKCPREGRRAVPIGSSAKALLEVSSVAWLHFAWQAWYFVTFQHVSRRVKNRFVWQAQYFCYISEDALLFSWQAQHFGHLRCNFAWQAQQFRRIVLRFFCKSHCQRCAKW